MPRLDLRLRLDPNMGGVRRVKCSAAKRLGSQREVRPQMSNLQHIKWVKAYASMLDSERMRDDVPCPLCGAPGIRHQFVGDPGTRVGYVAVWCEACRTGCTLSRVKIPLTQDMLEFTSPVDAINDAIPPYALCPEH
ncbi:MAG: hypothetical protein H6709_20715 [Kofleriaceae bacterium]|nr:hypothetical protein [Kofleriaceae bacterium]MCB9574506.1 hypothetical protein [Kofleriaceae bacterium]